MFLESSIVNETQIKLTSNKITKIAQAKEIKAEKDHKIMRSSSNGKGFIVPRCSAIRNNFNNQVRFRLGTTKIKS